MLTKAGKPEDLVGRIDLSVLLPASVNYWKKFVADDRVNNFL